MSDTTSEAIVAEAVDWIGTPYRHQGWTKGVGCDCLGLVRGVWLAVYGTALGDPGPYAADWAEQGRGDPLLEAAQAHCRAVERTTPRRGDLILFRWRPHLPAKHCAIALGPDRFVHAYQRQAVMQSSLVPQWSRRIAGLFVFPDRVS